VLLVDNMASSDTIAASQAVAAAGGEDADPSVVAQILAKFGLTPGDLAPDAVLDAMASAFTDTFVIATVLIALVLVPAFFLPRKRLEQAPDPTVMVGH